MERTIPVIILVIFLVAIDGTTTTIEATRQVPTKEEIYNEFYALDNRPDSNEFPSFEANYDAKAADQGGHGKGSGVGKGNDGDGPGIGGGYGGGGYGKGPGIGGGYGGGVGHGGDHGIGGGDYGKGSGIGGGYGGYGGGPEGYHPGYGGGGYGGYGGGQEGYHPYPGYGGGGYSGYPYYPGIFGYPRIPFFSPWRLPWLWPGGGYWKKSNNQGKDVPREAPKADGKKKSP